MQAMLLAAGLGTRLRPYTNILPKPLFPVLNRPLLHLLIDMLHRAGCSKIVVNGHYLSRMLEQSVSSLPDVEFQEEQVILGTGGGIRRALSRFSREPILVMNGDIFHDIDPARLYQHHIDSKNSITMAMHDYPRFNSVTVDNDRIVSFQDAGKVPDRTLLAFTGIHVVDPEVINLIPADRPHHIIDLYESLARQGMKIGFVRVDDSYWRDIGTPDDYLQLHGELLTGCRAKNVSLPGAAGHWLIDSRAKVADDAVLTGWGCIGRAEIGRGAALHNCVIWNDAVVADGSRRNNRIIAGRGD
ncbi:MAG: sugar phosphate nucleotidyltransferase [Desulfobulbaceae bacterium]|nr:sugar phosphate nucleotidyltransferase [Desulfobulbaceae bacterium]